MTPAQDIFPPNEPRQIFTEDAGTASAGNLPSGVIQYNWTQTSTGVGSSTTAVACGGGFWGTHLVQTEARASNYSAAINRAHPLAPLGTSSVFVVDQSVVGHGGYLPTDWENFRFEFDFSADANSAVGVVWGGSDTQPDVTVDHGYLFYIDELPTRTEAVDDGDRARWHLVRRQSGYDLELDSGDLEPNAGSNDLLSVYNSACYRLRLDFFCGTLRIQIARINCGATDCTVTQCNGGTTTCSPGDYSICNPDDIEWCTVLDWIDPDPLLVPGFVGPFAGGTSTATLGVSRFDNLVASTWDYDCDVICSFPAGETSAWSDWTDDWDLFTSGEGVEELDLKYLYTGTVIDWHYGYVFGHKAYVDITTKSGPTAVTLIDGSVVNRDNCGGWTVLHTNVEKPVVDLPSLATADSNGLPRAHVELGPIGV